MDNSCGTKYAALSQVLNSDEPLHALNRRQQERAIHMNSPFFECGSAGLAFQQCAGHPDYASPNYSRRRVEVGFSGARLLPLERHELYEYPDNPLCEGFLLSSIAHSRLSTESPSPH
jgi:hypothetical protein